MPRTGFEKSLVHKPFRLLSLCFHLAEDRMQEGVANPWRFK
jgi:hypothetical protein